MVAQSFKKFCFSYERNGTRDDDIFREDNKDHDDLDTGVIHPDIPMKKKTS